MPTCGQSFSDTGPKRRFLLYPDAPEGERLYEDLESMGLDFLPRRPQRIQHIREWALSQFVRSPSDAQRAFLSRNLNTVLRSFEWDGHASGGVTTSPPQQR